MSIEHSLKQLTDMVDKLEDLGLDVFKVNNLHGACRELSVASMKMVDFPVGTAVTVTEAHAYWWDAELGDFEVPVGAKGVVTSNVWSFTDREILSANVKIEDHVDGSATNVTFTIPQNKLKKVES